MLLAVSAESVVVGVTVNDCCARAAGMAAPQMAASADESAIRMIEFRYFEPCSTAGQMASDSHEFA